MRKLFEKQGWHTLFLAVLLIAVFCVSQDIGMQIGSIAGIKTPTWLWISTFIPVAHQVFVGLGWRAQLHYQWMTRIFGDKDFFVFGVFFILFLLARPVSIIILAISNASSYSLNAFLRAIIGVILFIPVVYLLYSIGKYFGVKRAMGIDHFDPAYKDLPMVTEGIFKYTRNAMYTCGFLVLWLPGVIWVSKAALLSAAFSHLYIWVHYFTVEKPDMGVIYEGESK
jgi:protein-S-isoprenylcysteine O-methyltransferase Ste14